MWYGTMLRPAAAAAAIGLACVAPRAGDAALLSHWAFDEAPGATTAVDSAGSNDGALQGTAAIVGGGISGNALSLDGSATALVNMGNVLSLGSTAFSVVAWIKMTDTAHHRFIVGKHTAGSFNGYLLGVNRTGASISDYGAADKALFYNASAPGGEAVSGATVNDGEWHQIVGVYNPAAAAKMSIYIDGVLDGTDTASPSGGPNTTGAFLIGGINHGSTPTNHYTGMIDEVSVYNHALSAAEVAQLFEDTPAVPAPAAIGLFGLGLAGIAALRRRRRG